MPAKQIQLQRFKLIPLAGWAFIIFGIIIPLENRLLYLNWLVVIFLCAGVHTLQLFVSLPIGKRLNIPASRVIFNTIVFGATYWKPLKDSLKESAPISRF